jgi:glucose/arabinose dehydrogenase
MKRTLAAAALMAALALAGCGQAPADEAPAAAEAVAAADAAAPAAAAAVPAEPAGAATPAAPGAPAFAVVYPGGAAQGPATVARGPDGPGGILSFTTEAAPDAVIDFYRKRAEAAGLASVMAMNTGDARAYGAAASDGSGKLLRVVATPVEDGPTSVQLDWTAGR